MTRESCRDTTLILSIDPGTIHSLLECGQITYGGPNDGSKKPSLVPVHREFMPKPDGLRGGPAI